MLWMHVLYELLCKSFRWCNSINEASDWSQIQPVLSALLHVICISGLQSHIRSPHIRAIPGIWFRWLSAWHFYKSLSRWFPLSAHPVFHQSHICSSWYSAASTTLKGLLLTTEHMKWWHPGLSCLTDSKKRKVFLISFSHLELKMRV